MRYFITVLMSIIAITLNAQLLLVGTYNIRNDNAGDRKAGNGWDKRGKVITDMINFEQPDIFGVQEALIGQMHDLHAGLEGYEYIGVGRDDGKESGEFSAIFYNSNKLLKLNEGNFWLNETPDIPALGWDAACIRICSWGKFQDLATKQKFYFFNLHMDHIGVVARREAAKLVVKKIKEIAGSNENVVLTGDFNVDQNDEIYKIFINSGLLKDSYTHAKYRFAENGTFQGFKSELYTDSRIDHIFVSKPIMVHSYAILTNGYWTESSDKEMSKEGNAPQEISFKHYSHRLPSDHYPVFAKIKVGR